MAKANLTLPNGTVVNIEGTPEEVKTLLEFYGGGASPSASARSKAKVPSPRKGRAVAKAANAAASSDSASLDISKVVAVTKDCDEADAIERQILDRTSQVDRTLLPLYIVHEHLNNAWWLSSGEISTVTAQLGVRVSISNVSKTLSGTASKYVMGDSVRRKGIAVKYKLNRRGIKYLHSVIQGTSGEDKA